MMTAAIIWKTVTGFLGKIPWQAYAAIALIAAFWWWGNNQYSAGVDATDAKWEQAAEKLKAQSEQAATEADIAKAIRDGEFADDQTELQGNIDAKKTDDLAGPGTTEYFDRLRAAKDSTTD